MERIFPFIVAILLVLPASVSFGAAFTANEQVTSTKLNTLNNANINSSAAIDPEKIDDHSANATEQDTTSDPYAGDTQTLATDLSVEERQLRFQIEQIINHLPASSGTQKWYNDLTQGAQGELPYYNGTRFTKLGVGTSGQFLKTQGASANPVWADLTATSFASRASAVRTTNQAITNATWTQITFTAEEYDNATEFASNQFTVGTAGGYLITAGFTFEANATGMRQLQLYKNGATMSPVLKMSINAFSGDSNGLVISREIELAANDTIRIYCYQDSTATINITNAFLTVSRRW